MGNQRGPPPDCQPIKQYRWVRTDSLIIQLILFNFPWYNWEHLRSVITGEIKAATLVQYSFAEKGFWIKYFAQNMAVKIPVEIFIRVVPLEPVDDIE